MIFAERWIIDMEIIYNNLIKKIDGLKREELEQNLEEQKTLPISSERIFTIVYSLLKLDRLEEAFSFWEKISGEDFEKCRVLLSSGYYRGEDGNLHEIYIKPENDSGNHHGGGGDNNCCGALCGLGCCIGGVGCFQWCIYGDGLDYICKLCEHCGCC